MTTITQVAKLAGVSPTTASYAVNGRSGVKEETRRRVLEAAEALHYVPNRVAQSFRNGRTNTITVVTNEAIESANTFTAEFFGVLAEARTHRYDVLVKLEDAREPNVQQVRALFGNRTSDGFLLLGNVPEIYVRCLTDSGACGVLLSSHSQFPVTQVNCDGRQGIRAMTREVLAAGRKAPVYLAFSNTTQEEKLRRQGFFDALTEAGRCTADSAEVCGTEIETVRACVKRRRAAGADCFVCWNDILARMVLTVLREEHCSVPQDAAVTGFDDIALSADEPILTTVHQPFFEKGRLAVQLLLQQIDGETVEPGEHFVDCPIVKRKSL